MILGFGRQERELAIDILKTCAKEAQENLDRRAEDVIGEIRSKYDAECKANDKMDRFSAPERYSNFYFSVIEQGQIGEAREFYAHFQFLHINRRHPMSPDGWSSLSTHWILRVCQVYGTIIAEAVHVEEPTPAPATPKPKGEE
jgi:hypothetical protein